MTKTRQILKKTKRNFPKMKISFIQKKFCHSESRHELTTKKRLDENQLDQKTLQSQIELHAKTKLFKSKLNKLWPMYQPKTIFCKTMIVQITITSTKTFHNKSKIHHRNSKLTEQTCQEKFANSKREAPKAKLKIYQLHTNWINSITGGRFSLQSM